ncbi:hypothetical protein [Bacillus cereus group sp. MYBK242-2]|uniref:hypothetical protein n=1 Tax=Bacillus cereus group sp. MYBK242-2 TaxID=3450647 RepID=UPI003F7AB91D
MYTDSIEYLAEQIYHHKTKEYFKEVLISYTNGNNRSAVVMLYSVVICDLIYKLKELKEKYNDSTASDILTKIKEEQQRYPTRSNWESTLITEVNERTNLLEGSDGVNISYLRDHRHLSAHPVLDQLDILFKPNKENVRSHIRNMLEGVLCKSPLLSNKLTITFLDDLESIKDVLINNNDLNRYLESKYLSRINKPLSQKLFKDLWKFAFRSEDEKCNNNRNIIFRALKIIFESNTHQYLELIRNEKPYFSAISHNNEDILQYLQALFSSNPDLYNIIEEELKVLLKEKAATDIKIFARSVYLHENVKQHFEKLHEYIQEEEKDIEKRKHLPLETTERKFLYDFSNKNGYTQEFLNFMIQLFKESRNYDSGDLRFSYYIKLYIEEFNLEQYKNILEAINLNGQLSERRQAIEDNRTIKTAIEKKYPGEIDYKEYTDFKLKR